MSFGPMPDDAMEVTHDAALDGRLHLTQPKRGHRFGHDAILLAAAVPARSGDRVIDLGAGVGAAGLAVAIRVPGIDLTLLEIEPALTALAEQNIAANGFSNSARAIAMDASAVDALPAGSFDQVLMNPPFNDPALQASPDPLRRRAHASDDNTLAAWLASAARLLRDGGFVTLIGRDSGKMLSALGAFGEVTILPIHPSDNKPPIRAICRASKSGKHSITTLTGFVLNDSGGGESAAARRVLREAAALPLADQ